MTVGVDHSSHGLDQACHRFSAPPQTPIRCGRQTGPPEEKTSTQKKECHLKLFTRLKLLTSSSYFPETEVPGDMNYPPAHDILLGFSVKPRSCCIAETH